MMLHHLPGLIGPTELARARSLLDAADWEDGARVSGPQSRGAKRNHQVASTCAQLPALQALVVSALDASVSFFAAALPKRLFPPQFNRYAGAANAFGDHIDNAIRHPANAPRLRSDLSCTVFLNGPQDYDGGELVFGQGLARQRLKLAAGDAVLYSAHTVHRVEPVTRGTRLASFFWVESLVRERAQRELLLSLDQALSALRQRDGESAESVALMGCYHNLLRHWADT